MHTPCWWKAPWRSGGIVESSDISGMDHCFKLRTGPPHAIWGPVIVTTNCLQAQHTIADLSPLSSPSTSCDVRTPPAVYMPPCSMLMHNNPLCELAADWTPDSGSITTRIPCMPDQAVHGSACEFDPHPAHLNNDVGEHAGGGASKQV